MLHKIEDTPRGKYLVQLAVNSNIIVTIRVNNQQKDNGGLVGIKGIINIDPNWTKPEIYTTKGIRHLTEIRVLAHELGHAVTGNFDYNKYHKDGMWNVNDNENPIVTHLNPPLPARTQYPCVPDTC